MARGQRELPGLEIRWRSVGNQIGDRIRRRYVGQDVQTERAVQGLDMFIVGGSSGDDDEKEIFGIGFVEV